MIEAFERRLLAFRFSDLRFEFAEFPLQRGELFLRLLGQRATLVRQRIAIRQSTRQLLLVSARRIRVSPHCHPAKASASKAMISHGFLQAPRRGNSFRRRR